MALVITKAMAGSPLVSVENQGSVKEFALALPDGIEAARRMVLELSEVRLPRKAAVVFRARAVEEDGVEVPLGSVGMLAESNDAEGTTLHAVLRIDVTKALKRWRQSHPGVSGIRIRVAPYAGAQPLANLEWSIGEAELKLVSGTKRKASGSPGLLDDIQHIGFIVVAYIAIQVFGEGPGSAGAYR